MGRIHVLDDAVINKIAAGEVVERPASVVKEMVENALDAGATAIAVSLTQGGAGTIVVSDNGSGMERDDAFMALKRHATSKIAAADDLFSIQTMGFRGEALASIASVSRFSLATVAAGAEMGIKLETAGGEEVRERPWSGPHGTTIAVQDLFYNVPARAKFLKAPATELSYCHELMQAFALCHPEVALSLVHNEKEQFRVPAVRVEKVSLVKGGFKGEEALRERAHAVIGKDASALMYITAESRYGVLEGLISPPGVEKATAKHVFTFVNGRWVKDKTLRYGVLRGYHSHILKGRFPVAVIHVAMDPSLVDVNAHPAKTEVRFQYPGEVQNLLALAIRDKIRSGVWASAPDVPTSRSPGGVSRSLMKAPDDDGALGVLAHAEAPADLSLESSTVDPTGAATGGDASWRGATTRRPSDSFAAERDRSVTSTSRSFGVRETRPIPWERTSSRPFPPLAPVMDKASLDALLAGAPEPIVRADDVPGLPWNMSPEPEMSPVVMGGAEGDAAYPADTRGGAQPTRFLETPGIGFKSAAGSVIPWDEMTYMGAFDRCFLMFEGDGRLLVVDQHAFHERILFEKLTRDTSLLSQSQRLLVPEALDMAPTDVAHLMGQQSSLKMRGFDFEAEGQSTLVVKAVPTILVGRDITGLFGDIAKGLRGDASGEEPGDSNAELARLVLATAACHAAVRAGEELPPNELKQLLMAARDVDFVENCPHGRRVFRWWTRGQVAGWFDR